MLAGQDGVDALFHQALASPSHRVDAGFQGCRDLAVTPGFASIRCVRLQQDARLEQLPCRVLALANQCVQPLAFLIAELHHVLLYRDLFGSHESSPSVRYGTIDSKFHCKVKDAEQ